MSSGFVAPLARAGLDLLGVLPAARYDALVQEAWQSPRLLAGARSAVVVASGGSALWDALARSGGVEAGARDPVDHHTRVALKKALQVLSGEGYPSRALFAFEQLGGSYADFVALAQAAGLGARSRLGQLLHPAFGPWFSIRALLLTPLVLAETPALVGFDPCTGCPAPCQAACPTGAPGPGGFDRVACDRGREAHSACRETCAARRACPIGAPKAYPRDAEAHHMRFRYAGGPAGPRSRPNGG